jgi:hypothetical protein
MLSTTGVLAFFSVFIVGFRAEGSHPAMRAMAATWCVILCGGLLAGGWHLLNILWGKYDLVLDNLGGTIELPLTLGRKTRLRVPVANVESVDVETVLQRNNDGEQFSPKFAPRLWIGGLVPRSERLVEWHDEEKAENFVEWLRDQLPR